MNKVKTIKLSNLETHLGRFLMYGGSDEIEFLPFSGTNIPDGSYLTHCKEELGSQSVRKKFDCVLVVLPSDQVWSNKLNDYVQKEISITPNRIERIKKRVHTFEQKAKVARSVFAIPEGIKNAIYVKYSPRWCRNSVAHSVYASILRDAISEVFGGVETAGNDKADLEVAGWLVKLIQTHGFNVFGSIQHEGYDVGMVSLTKRLEDTNGVIKVQWEEPEEPDIEEPTYPFRGDYSSDEAFERAVDKYYEEDEVYRRAWEEYDGAYADWEDGYDSDYGDLDERIPDKHGYGKLEKEWQKLHKVKAK